jgi:hypothetical protein
MLVGQRTPRTGLSATVQLVCGGLSLQGVVGHTLGGNEGAPLVRRCPCGHAGRVGGRQVPSQSGRGRRSCGAGPRAHVMGLFGGEPGSSRRPVQQAVAADVRSPGPLDGGPMSRARGLAPACPRDRVTLERDRRRTPLNGRSLDGLARRPTKKRDSDECGRDSPPPQVRPRNGSVER